MIEFDKKLSVGNILVAASVVVSMAYGYITNGYVIHDLVNKENNDAQKIEYIENRVANIETNTNGALARIQDLLTKIQVDEAKYTANGGPRR